MATSGTYLFNPSLIEVVDEAFQRAQIDEETITARHILAAKASLNYMFRSWANDQINLWKVQEYTPPAVSQGANSIVLPTGTLDVTEATVQDSDNYETPFLAISRLEWREIPDKTLEGRPDRFWVDRQATQTPTMYFWQAMPATTHTFKLNVLYRVQDAGDTANTLDIPDEWFDAVADGLAVRLAQKFVNDKSFRDELTARAGGPNMPRNALYGYGSYGAAKRGNHERAPTRFVIAARGSRPYRRR